MTALSGSEAGDGAAGGGGGGGLLEDLINLNQSPSEPPCPLPIPPPFYSERHSGPIPTGYNATFGDKSRDIRVC